MFSTIVIAILLILATILFVGAARVKLSEADREFPHVAKAKQAEARTIKRGMRGIGGVFMAGGLIWLLLVSVFPQSVGEARVIINVDGNIAGEKLDPGWGVKAPWQTTNDWDLFAQQATYAGNESDGTPSYTGGEVNGYEITTQVRGGAQVNFDLSLTYDQSAANVTELYSQFRSQERFTQQVVNNQILSISRDIPSSYSPVEFRGEKRGEATTRILEALNNALSKYGVEVSVVNLQNIRYTEEVEASIKNVEVAQQKEQEAEANLRATEVSAQVVEAQAEADANRLRAESLTPELIEANRVEALRTAAEKGSLIVVPDGSSPLIQVPGQ